LSSRYGVVPVDVFDAQISCVDIAVYAAIATFAGRDGAAFPSITRIASMTQQSRRWVMESIKRLEAAELISVKRIPGKRNKYVLEKHPF